MTTKDEKKETTHEKIKLNYAISSRISFLCNKLAYSANNLCLTCTGVFDHSGYAFFAAITASLTALYAFSVGTYDRTSFVDGSMTGISSKEMEEVVAGIDWKVPLAKFLKRGMMTSSQPSPSESRCNQGTSSPAFGDAFFTFVEVDDDDNPCHRLVDVALLPVVSPTVTPRRRWELEGEDDEDGDEDEDGEEDARTALLEATLLASRGNDDDNDIMFGTSSLFCLSLCVYEARGRVPGGVRRHVVCCHRTCRRAICLCVLSSLRMEILPFW